MATMTRNKKTARTVLSMLPEEMELEVLTRLPAKSILRFSAVCRRWAALLSSDEFCSTWTKLAESTTTEMEPAAQLLFLSLPSCNAGGPTEVRTGGGTQLFTLDDARRKFVAISPAPCHGLSILHKPLSMSEPYHVLNATTRASAKLPPPPSCRGNWAALYPSTAGLGFDARAKTHKVVRLFNGSGERSGDKSPTIKCELYTLGSGPADRRWRPPSPTAADGGVVPSTLAGPALLTATKDNLEPVFVDGFLHWLVNPTMPESMPVAVLSFSVADETFGCWVRPPPFDWDGRGTAHLTELDGRLCMVRDLRRHNSAGLLEIWKYGNGGDCWSLELRIDLALAAQHVGRDDLTGPRHVRVLGKKNKVIFIATSKGKVVTYDPVCGALVTIFQLGASRPETRLSLSRVSLFKHSLATVY
jgi:F-box interacting protein